MRIYDQTIRTMTHNIPQKTERSVPVLDNDIRTVNKKATACYNTDSPQPTSNWNDSGKEESKTGYSLTPSDQEVAKYSIGIDWLTVSFVFPSEEVFHGFLKGIYGDFPYIFIEQSVRLSADKVYPMSIRSGLSIQAGYEKGDGKEVTAGEKQCQVRGAYEHTDDGNYRGFIQLRGKYWEKLTIGEMMGVLNHCEYYRCSYSRLDLRLDDWNYNIFPYQEMMKAWERGDIAGFKKAGYNQEGTPDSLNWRYSFGGRKSEAYTRGYNHDWGEDENLAQRESHRWEGEFKGKKAKEVVQLLCGFKPESGKYPNTGLYKNWALIEVGDVVETKDGCEVRIVEWNYHNECFVVEDDDASQDVFYPSQLTPIRENPKTWEDKISDYIIELLVGQIDFVDKSKRQGKRVNKKDCKRLDFWQEVLDKLGEGIKISVTRKRPSLESTIDWLKRQVAPTLAIFYEGMGEADYMGFLSHLVGLGYEKWKDKHENLADTISIELDKGMFLY